MIYIRMDSFFIQDYQNKLLFYVKEIKKEEMYS